MARHSVRAALHQWLVFSLRTGLERNPLGRWLTADRGRAVLKNSFFFFEGQPLGATNRQPPTAKRKPFFNSASVVSEGQP